MPNESEEEVLNYYNYDPRRKKYIKGTSKTMPAYQRVMARMPIPLLKLAGSLLYKHMG